eukprot:2779866-Rhodomonas_salina.9
MLLLWESHRINMSSCKHSKRGCLTKQSRRHLVHRLMLGGCWQADAVLLATQVPMSERPFITNIQRGDVARPFSAYARLQVPTCVRIEQFALSNMSSLLASSSYEAFASEILA